MKLIVAYVREERLPAVEAELFRQEVFKISALRADGCGGVKPAGGGDWTPRVRLEIAVNEPFVQVTQDAILRGAQTGETGDGKIFVLPLDECVRVRDGETGMEAIG